MHGLEVADRDLNGSRCRNKERRNRSQAQKTRGKADVQATIFIWMPTIETRRDSESKHRGHGLAKANRRDAEYSDERQSGHRAHVHRQSAERRRPHEALEHASPDG